MVQPPRGPAQPGAVRPDQPGQTEPSQPADGHGEHGEDRRGIPVLAGGQVDQEGEASQQSATTPVAASITATARRMTIRTSSRRRPGSMVIQEDGRKARPALNPRQQPFLRLLQAIGPRLST